MLLHLLGFAKPPGLKRIPVFVFEHLAEFDQRQANQRVGVVTFKCMKQCDAPLLNHETARAVKRLFLLYIVLNPGRLQLAKMHSVFRMIELNDVGVGVEYADTGVKVRGLALAGQKLFERVVMIHRFMQLLSVKRGDLIRANNQPLVTECLCRLRLGQSQPPAKVDRAFSISCRLVDVGRAADKVVRDSLQQLSSSAA